MLIPEKLLYSNNLLKQDQRQVAFTTADVYDGLLESPTMVGTIWGSSNNSGKSRSTKTHMAPPQSHHHHSNYQQAQPAHHHHHHHRQEKKDTVINTANQLSPVKKRVKEGSPPQGMILLIFLLFLTYIIIYSRYRLYVFNI